MPRVRWLATHEVNAFAETVVLTPTRTLPMVALTTDARTGELTVDAGWLTEHLDGQADVVALETGDATRILSDALPAGLGVNGGAVRVWWPLTTRGVHPHAHPLMFVAPLPALPLERRILNAIRGGSSPGRTSTAAATDGTRAQKQPCPPPAPLAPVQEPTPRAVAVTGAGDARPRPSHRPRMHATVMAIQGRLITLASGDQRGVLAYADEKHATLAARLHVGDELEVFVAGHDARAGVLFSSQRAGRQPAAQAEPLPRAGQAQVSQAVKPTELRSVASKASVQMALRRVAETGDPPARPSASRRTQRKGRTVVKSSAAATPTRSTRSGSQNRRAEQQQPRRLTTSDGVEIAVCSMCGARFLAHRLPAHVATCRGGSVAAVQSESGRRKRGSGEPSLWVRFILGGAPSLGKRR